MDELTYIWACVLGLIQGLTEFLPISSSGHLALAEHLGEGVKENNAYDVLLHLATVIAVLGAFYKDIVDIFKIKENRVVIGYIILATIPVGIIGFKFKEQIEAITKYPLLICVFLLLNAVLLFISDRMSVGEKKLKDLGWLGALIIGSFQVVGMLPGISRSGSTILGGLKNKLGREQAVKFSFLMMVPAVLGANLLKAIKDTEQFKVLPIGPAVLGFIVALISGVVAARWMLKLVKGKHLSWFGYYCAVVGIVGLIYFGLVNRA